MTRAYVLKTIDKFARKKHIKVYFNSENVGRNKGETTGDAIYFGRFTNNEYLLIAFFHEYAHCALGHKIPGKIEGYHWNNTTQMQYEIQITMAGLNFAQKNGIIFSNKAVKWLLTENFSYITDKFSGPLAQR